MEDRLVNCVTGHSVPMTTDNVNHYVNNPNYFGVSDND